ncbi:radial spoke head 1 homolog [Rhopilema esculentum]|uniref:radial spoke head 1 homolog n=1 Tax=Rhopilema esculentum TaxID=499914 RepID=UPI0031DC3A6C|eukprot:gene7628-13444_t
MGCICPKQEKKTEGEDDYIEFGKYIGERNCLGQRHGRGQYYYDTGDTYDGMWKRNKKHGYGKYTFSNGEVTEGIFENDKYVGELAPPEVSYDDNEPLAQSEVSRPMEEPMVRPSSRGDAEVRRQSRQKKLDEMKKKYGVRKT